MLIKQRTRPASHILFLFHRYKHKNTHLLPFTVYEDYYSYKNGNNPLWRNPYKFIDFYDAKCDWYGTTLIDDVRKD